MVNPEREIFAELKFPSGKTKKATREPPRGFCIP